MTPAHFGNGDGEGDDLTDMPLLVDPSDGKTPLLTGATLAGALRSSLRARERGYREPLPAPEDSAALQRERRSATVRLFGGFRADDEGEQSALIVDDALGRNAGRAVREGVRIRPDSRTAEEGKLFNREVWEAGTTFSLRLELLVRKGDDALLLRRALATALSGLGDGSITLGARKQRGYGRVAVADWRVRTYDLPRTAGLLAWLTDTDPTLTAVGPDIATALGVPLLEEDQRSWFSIAATFTLDGSLLIRSGSGQDDLGPDMVHLHARQPDGALRPVLSGTSLGGALRARALKIATTLGSVEQARGLIAAVFGPEILGDVHPRASRLMVSEQIIDQAVTHLVQSRVSIDRFTGGARETALFNEQPVFGAPSTTIAVHLRLINPQLSEIGLLLLVLKDLWTGDLPLGGESAVGRGRLQGREATLRYHHPDASAPDTWTIAADGPQLRVAGDRGALKDFVSQLAAMSQEETV